ncbi:hypothetical protein [Agromyces sp. Leaf222]|uniref:hypothetical protein n=1 Tax=Agromyces sp. Leaf222 TaxID=1735688 RepID=UPI0012F9CC4B|nr:hypothetical protein [Agromyces sp. Leaf222]
MTLQQYLQEDGTGTFRNFRVPDLVPGSGDDIELLLVLESPHVDELRTGRPLAGDAGQRALAFLSPTGKPQAALGPYLALLHANSDFRIGIINVSPVPLQSAAFARHRLPPVLVQSDWELLEMVRSHRASTIANLPTRTARNANTILLPGLQARLDGVNLSSNATVFIAGNFVHRTWESLASPPKRVMLPIPHPSNGWWTRTKVQKNLDHLAELKSQFARLTS